jgi:transposase-like protein
MSKCRKYSPEFRQEAVQLIRMDGVTISQVLSMAN